MLSALATHYLLQKWMAEKQLRQLLLNILPFVQIIPIDSEMIKRGLQSKNKDFEDELQLQSAYSIKDMDCLITRNRKDYMHAVIPVLSPDEFIRTMR